MRKVKVASRYSAFNSSKDLFIKIVLNFNFEFKVLTDCNERSEMLGSLGRLVRSNHDMYSRMFIFIRLS